jgi:RHS repeat-associated protein
VRSETSNYQYDDLNRLLNASVSYGPNPYTQGLTYDPLGNITQRTDNGTPTNYTYDTNNKPHAVRQAGTQTYQYDANGISTFYVGDSYVISVNGQVATASKYYTFGALRVAVKFGSTLYYLHADHLGSTGVATDTNGNPISKQTYYAFGAVRTSEGTSPTDYGCAGQRFDASSSLMYYGARSYDPVLGRFTQADTIAPNAWNPQGFNRFAYVYNDPRRYTDPSGNCVPEFDTCGLDAPPPNPNFVPTPTPEPTPGPSGICDTDPTDPRESRRE